MDELLNSIKDFVEDPRPIVSGSALERIKQIYQSERGHALKAPIKLKKNLVNFKSFNSVRSEFASSNFGTSDMEECVEEAQGEEFKI